jgi:hypothetical protein
MKRTAYMWLAGTILMGMLVSFASAQSDSLGDYARAVRKENKPTATKTFDNDNLPKTEKLSIVGNESDGSSGAATAGNGESADAQSVQPHDPNQTADPAADKKQAADAWKTKIADQQGKLDLLSRELDVAQREYRLRAAAMYGDVGNRLRNQGAWDKEDADYKKKIADKQKAVEDAQKSLSDMQEQARKAGASGRQ